ncbi:MAG: PQQ-like beta-propeller repeat protein [Verrucomicrobiae bacterium]|nr:PQQ-like beta-propeller repeat protein [Verrucomicrobiae bacterium]
MSFFSSQWIPAHVMSARYGIQQSCMMKSVAADKRVWFVPICAGVAATAALLWWFRLGPGIQLSPRLPGTDRPPGEDTGAIKNPVLTGKLTLGTGKPADLAGVFPGFRGVGRTGAVADGRELATSWSQGMPKELWSVEMGEGYAGAAIWRGRVYVLDYDQVKKEDALRCLSLADGAEIWRFSYPVNVKRNHGMSRTVPAVNDHAVVTLGPKCHVACVDPVTGQLKWGIDLVREYGATIPQWYAGQCPLIDGNRVILAPGGKDALLMAVDLDSGRPVWKTPNPHHWKMTHSSIMPTEFKGKRLYVYCADKGVVGVSADDGTLLWETTDWKISIATVPSPVPIPGDRIFLSGGYDAGSMMLELTESDGRITPKTVFRLEASTFGAAQHTPIFFNGYIYGVRPDGRFTCLDTTGKIIWTSDANNRFGLGPFLLVGDVFFVLSETGKLCMIRATPERCMVLAQAQVLKGREAWAPIAFADGRLIVRDLTRMVCLDVRKKD